MASKNVCELPGKYWKILTETYKNEQCKIKIVNVLEREKNSCLIFLWKYSQACHCRLPSWLLVWLLCASLIRTTVNSSLTTLWPSSTMQTSKSLLSPIYSSMISGAQNFLIDKVIARTDRSLLWHSGEYFSVKIYFSASNLSVFYAAFNFY